MTYHNKTHATDLSFTAYNYAKVGGFASLVDLDELEAFTMIVAGACHDLGHPGFNNAFIVNSSDDIAITYND